VLIQIESRGGGLHVRVSCLRYYDLNDDDANDLLFISSKLVIVSL